MSNHLEKTSNGATCGRRGRRNAMGDIHSGISVTDVDKLISRFAVNTMDVTGLFDGSCDDIESAHESTQCRYSHDDGTVLDGNVICTEKCWNFFDLDITSDIVNRMKNRHRRNAVPDALAILDDAGRCRFLSMGS